MKSVENHYPIVSDRRHVHREMLKNFAYLALADGEGLLDQKPHGKRRGRF